MNHVVLDLHAYADGSPFVTVRCQTCNAVLNSGHHYRYEHVKHAIHLGQDHVDSNHGGKYLG